MVLFLNGGPSDPDMWNVKSEATSEIRSELRWPVPVFVIPSLQDP